MKNKHKKIALVLVLIGALFLFSGCAPKTVEDAETGKQVIKLITSETTFASTIDSEGWFESFLVFPLAKLINYLSPLISVPGAIAVVTILINGIVLLFTFKATMSTQKLQFIQPEINRITAKYKGKTDNASKMAQGREMQELYKKHGIKPLSSLLVQFIQFPIMISIWHAVQRSYAVQNGSFLGMDLTVSPWTGILNFELSYLVLYILIAAAQIASMKLPPYLAEQEAKREAEAQGRRYRKSENPLGKMTNYMMAPLLIFSLVFSSGMGIYWIISALVNISKSLFIQHHSNKSKKKELI